MKLKVVSSMDKGKWMTQRNLKRNSSQKIIVFPTLGFKYLNNYAKLYKFDLLHFYKIKIEWITYIRKPNAFSYEWIKTQEIYLIIF